MSRDRHNGRITANPELNVCDICPVYLLFHGLYAVDELCGVCLPISVPMHMSPYMQYNAGKSMTNQ